MEDKMPEDTEPDDTSILFVSPLTSFIPRMFLYCADDEDDVLCRDEQEGSIISSLISQLRCVLVFPNLLSAQQT